VNFFTRLKQYLAIAARYNKRAATSLGVIHRIATIARHN